MALSATEDAANAALDTIKVIPRVFNIFMIAPIDDIYHSNYKIAILKS